MKLTAAIFDLNGTVLNDEKEWGIAFKKVLNSLGENSLSEYPHIAGIGVEENWPLLIKKYNIKTNKTAYELGSLTKHEYKKLIPRIDLTDGFTSFIEGLRESGVRTALATSSTWDGIEEVLDEFYLEKYFDHITTGEEARNKKPDPELFNITLEKLGVDPIECLVFEDAVAGVNAALSAGMHVIGISTNKVTKKLLIEAGADETVASFEEVTPELIDNIKELS